MELSSPYALPYDVLYEQHPLMSIGQDVRVRVVLRAAVSLGAVEAIDSLVLPFVLLATSGALAGDSIAPWISTIGEKQGPFADERVVEWILPSCAVDERSVTVLSQMLLSIHEYHPLATVRFSGTDPAGISHRVSVGTPVWNPYPPVYMEPAFPTTREEDIGGELVVRASFQSPTEAEARKAVEAELFSWAAGLLSGAYGVAPVRPDECAATVSEDAFWMNSELTWSLSRFRAHPAALDGLVNAFTSISRRIARISHLALE